MALLEYRKKNSQALELYNAAADKFKTIMTAADISKLHRIERMRKRN